MTFYIGNFAYALGSRNTMCAEFFADVLAISASLPN